MFTSASSNFAELMIMGMRIEEGVWKWRLVKESVPTDSSEDEDQEESMVKSQPQHEYPAYYHVAIVMPNAKAVQNPVYQPQFQQYQQHYPVYHPVATDVQNLGYQPQYQQQPQQQASGQPQFDLIPMKYAELLPDFLGRNLVQIRPPPWVPKKLPAGYMPDLFCVFHQGAPGHDIEQYFAFRTAVQKLIQDKALPF